jgi:hypothetical protein
MTKRTQYLIYAIAFALGVLFCLATETSGGWIDPPPCQVSIYIYTVEEGDSLWSVAREYSRPGCDLRMVVEEIRGLNRLDSAVIYPGQLLMVPIKEENHD